MTSEKETPYEKLERLFLGFIDNYGEDGLEDILSNLENPEKLSYDNELLSQHTSPVCSDPYFHTYFSQIRNKIFTKDYDEFLRYVYGVRLRTTAKDILPKELGSYAAILRVFTNIPKGWPFTRINRQEFESIYLLLEKLYFIQSEHRINAENLLNIYFSGLDERLVFFQDQFDIVLGENIPKPSKDFFKLLKYLKYEDKTIQYMKHDLRYLIVTAVRYYSENGRVGGWETDVLKTLTYCSAVSDGRNKIIRDDVVRAFNAYFKLLNTDVTKYKARQNIINSTNYNNFRAKWTYYNLKFTHKLTPY